MIQMKKQVNLALLFSPSELTPWKENINYHTISCIVENLPNFVHASIIEFKGFEALEIMNLKQFDIVLNLCYGLRDINQVDVSTWLTTQNINHTSSHPEAMAIAQDKALLPKICSMLGLLTPSILDKVQLVEKEVIYVQKPRYGSCHRGISLLNSEDAKVALFNSQPDVIIQQYIVGREFSIAVIPDSECMHYEALMPVEIIPVNYNGAFILGQKNLVTEKIYVPNLQDETLLSLKETALKIHGFLGLSFMSRIDVRMTDSGDIFVLDINSLPNLDPSKSLLPKICTNQNISYKELLDRIIRLGLIQQVKIRDVLWEMR